MRITPGHARAAALLPIVVIVAALCGGCGGGSGGDTDAAAAGASSAGPSAVEIVDYEYAPPDLTVAAGTTLKFSNEDSTSHTATSRQPGAFDSGTIKPGKSGAVALEKPGTYAYYCVFHPFMKGTVTVE